MTLTNTPHPLSSILALAKGTRSTIRTTACSGITPATTAITPHQPALAGITPRLVASDPSVESYNLSGVPIRGFFWVLSIYLIHQNDENNSFFFSINLSYSFYRCCRNPPCEDIFLTFRRSHMSPVIDAPESLPATALPTVDDASVCGSSTTAPLSWWRILLSRFNQPLFSVDGSKPPPEAAIDYLAREHPFLYMKALSG
jgi:hypothetical protein